ncbi:hypothetical protein IQ257_14810 [Coleofasciculus sp. LEGE 07092]|nr:hypothetical protein [Coleofasciculus sp. LEGE 07092]
MAGTFGCIWLTTLNQQTDLLGEEKRLSYIVLVVATILWPLVVPISYLEKLSRA